MMNVSKTLFFTVVFSILLPIPLCIINSLIFNLIYFDIVYSKRRFNFKYILILFIVWDFIQTGFLFINTFTFSIMYVFILTYQRSVLRSLENKECIFLNLIFLAILSFLSFIMGYKLTYKFLFLQFIANITCGMFLMHVTKHQ